jgi:hypothetical protein
MDDDERTEEEKEDDRTPGLVLMGFGKYKLKEMLEWIDTDREEDLLLAFKKWPGVYREERIADEEDIAYACKYLAYIQDVILEYDLQHPEGDKENKDGNC